MAIQGTDVIFTPAADFNGAASFSYTVTDNGTTNGAADPKTAMGTISFTVGAVNDAPSFTVGGNQAVLEDAGGRTVAGFATNIEAGPPDEAGQTLMFLVTNTNNAPFSAQPSIGANGTLTYTPAANTSGSATVSVRLMDNGGTANGGQDTSAAQTFVITVAPSTTPLRWTTRPTSRARPSACSGRSPSPASAAARRSRWPSPRRRATRR